MRPGEEQRIDDVQMDWLGEDTLIARHKKTAEDPFLWRHGEQRVENHHAEPEPRLLPGQFEQQFRVQQPGDQQQTESYKDKTGQQGAKEGP